MILLDRKGEVHIFFLNDANTGIIRPAASPEARRSEAYQSRLDIWHTKSTGALTKWPPPKMIWKGRAGICSRWSNSGVVEYFSPSLT